MEVWLKNFDSNKFIVYYVKNILFKMIVFPGLQDHLSEYLICERYVINLIFISTATKDRRKVLKKWRNFDNFMVILVSKFLKAKPV